MQTDYGDMGPLLVGDPANSRELEPITAINNDPRAKQKHTITVDSDHTGELKVTIDDQEIVYDAPAGDTIADIADGLADAINAEPLVSGTVKATSDGASKVTVEALVGGNGFTISESDANLSLAEDQANATADAVPFGRAVMFGGASTSKVSDNRLALLAKASKLTAQSIELTPEVLNDTLYRIYIDVAGKHYEVEYTSDGTATAQEIVEGLKTDFDAVVSSDLLTATEDDATLTITAATAGLAFHVDYNDRLTKSAETEGDDFNAEFLGFSLRQESIGQEDGKAEYPANDTMSITPTGPLVAECEESVAYGDQVWVRLAANGSLDKLGAVRGSQDAGCVPLEGFKFGRELSSTKAVVEKR